MLKDWPVPSNIKELRNFLGFAGYYSRFVCTLLTENVITTLAFGCMKVWLNLSLRKRYNNDLYKLWKRFVGINRKQTLSKRFSVSIIYTCSHIVNIGIFCHVVFNGLVLAVLDNLYSLEQSIFKVCNHVIAVYSENKLQHCFCLQEP